MRDNLREQLNVEITRKQFLQYMTTVALMVFGLNNLVSLLTSGKIGVHPGTARPGDERDGFGGRKFGV